jgi:hypothetical protein
MVWVQKVKEGIMPWIMAIVVGLGIYAGTRLFLGPTSATARKNDWINYYTKQSQYLINKGMVENIAEGNLLIVKAGRLINNIDPTPDGEPPKVSV